MIIRPINCSSCGDMLNQESIKYQGEYLCQVCHEIILDNLSEAYYEQETLNNTKYWALI